MTIEEFKNQMKEAANEFFTTTAKDAIVTGLKNTVLPALRETSKPVTDKLKEDAANEQGWNKFRDGVFLPGVISIAFWGAEKLLDHMAQPKEVPSTNVDAQSAM